MKFGIQEIDWKTVGARLANEDDNEQAAFFVGMLKEMYTWGSRHQVETQLNNVALKLSNDYRTLLEMLGNFNERPAND